MKDQDNPRIDGIAIIGMAGRFPGAETLEQFWDNLKNGVESISVFSEEELKAAGMDATLTKIPGFVNAGSVLSDVDMFDAAFFGFSARDAETTDPQQRLFLECAWESLENAGYCPDNYPGLIGVFGGSDQSTYVYQIYANLERLATLDAGMVAIGNDKDYLTTHVSYKLNLKGPSVAVQTACSTSLVAVCLACQSAAGAINAIWRSRVASRSTCRRRRATFTSRAASSRRTAIAARSMRQGREPWSATASRWSC